MSLIDPTTPDGFFHLRLVPYKFRLIEEGRSFFPTGPDPERESYFEEPSPAGQDGIESDPAMLTAKTMLEKLRADWAEEGDTLLVEMTEPLEDLRRQIVTSRPPDKEEEISDFVYPLF